MIFLNFLILIVGFVALVKGADAFVDGSSALAKIFRVPGVIIGLTVVAMGTSLPELVTSIVAAKKGETGLAVGNVVGSNLFNVLFILGVSTAIHPVTANVASIYDMTILIFISILTLIFSISGKSIKRLEGIIMLLCYIGATTFAIIR